MSAEHFAARLRELRQEAGLSQQELADKAALSKWGIADLEQGRRAALGVECTAFTVAPKDEPAPRRGRPRKPSASEQAPAEEKPAGPEAKKPAAKKSKRKKGGRE